MIYSKKILWVATFIVVGALIFSAASVSLAAGPLDQATANLNSALNNPNNPTGLVGGSQGLGQMVGTVISAVLAVVGTIFLALTVYAGITWMTASGNEEKITKAVDILKASAIGLFITLAAYAITFFVSSKLGGAANGGTAITTSAECGSAGGKCSNTSASTCAQISTQNGGNGVSQAIGTCADDQNDNTTCCSK